VPIRGTVTKRRLGSDAKRIFNDAKPYAVDFFYVFTLDKQNKFILFEYALLEI